MPTHVKSRDLDLLFHIFVLDVIGGLQKSDDPFHAQIKEKRTDT